MAQEIQNKDEGMTTSTWWLMIATAAFFDTIKLLLEFIPVLGQFLDAFVSAFVFMTIVFWMWIKGVKYSVGPMFLGFGLDEIPVLNALPFTTGTVVFQYIKWKERQVVAAVPGGKLAVSAVQKGRNEKKVNQLLEKGKLETPPDRSAQLTRQPIRESSSTNTRPRKNIQEWEEGTKRLNDQQNKTLINKTFAGGIDKFNTDGEKNNNEWNRAKEARERANKARSTYLEENRAA